MELLQQYFSDTLIYALGWTVIHSLWQGALVALVMALLMQNLRNKSARLRYELGSLCLFIVFILSFSTFLLLYDSVEKHSLEALLSGEFGLLMHFEEESGFLAQMIQSGMDYFNHYLPFIVLVWMLGAVFFSLRLLGGWAYVQHIKKQDTQLLPDYWQQKMQQLSKRLRMKESLTLLESKLISVPMVIGFFKPVILLPVGAVNSLSEKEVEAILAHELAHIVRNDYLMNILLSFIEVLFYYHPAVWWISANVRIERENCCDDVAVQLCGNSLVYAKALVNLQEMHRIHSVPSFAMPFSGNKNQLLNRVKRILNQPQNRSNIMEKLTATSLLLFTLAFLSISAKTPIDYPEYEEVNIWEYLDLPENAEAYVLPNDEAIIAEVTHYRLAPILDTIPTRKKGRKRIVKTEDGETVEIIMEDGDIENLIINGEAIPDQDLAEYEELIVDMVEEFEAIPAPPAPPAPPTPFEAPEPPVPPLPDFPEEEIEELSFYRAHSLNSATVTTKKGKNNETIIIVKEEGREPMEIIVNKDNDAILIDGNVLEDGDTTVIVEEYLNDIEAPLIYLHRNSNHHDGVVVAPRLSYSKKAAKEFRAAMKKMAKKSRELQKAYQEQIREWKKSLTEDDKAAQEELRSLLDRQEVDMEKLQNQIHELYERNRVEQAEMRQLAHKERQIQRQAQRRIQQKLRKERQRVRQSVRQKNRKHRHHRDDHRELHTDVHFEDKGYFDSEIREAFEKEMAKDGHIDKQQTYKFELTPKYFKINGKEQDKATFEKYLSIYENLSGYELNGKSKIKVRSKE